MRLLPSEQKRRINAALKDFEMSGTIIITEPCDCGGQIRHNNGGNYHCIIELALDEGKLYIRESSTYENDYPEWLSCEFSAEEIINNYADWLPDIMPCTHMIGKKCRILLKSLGLS